MNVISLAEAKAAREPYVLHICLGCRHEWKRPEVGGPHLHIECPACGLHKGATKYVFDAPEGHEVMVCECECEALMAHRYEGRLYVMCMACGGDLSHAFWDDV